APAQTFCFAVSDVPGDDLSAIGSGPCVPDPTRIQLVIDLLQRVNLFTRISPSFRKYLVDTAQGIIPETPKVGHPAFAHVTARVISNNGLALEAAAGAARKLGYVTSVREQPLVGEASVAAEQVAQALLSARDRAQPGSTLCVIWGGETTVTLRGPGPRGGRCQELALAVSKYLA